jgi:hypothetical protein
MHGPLFEQSEDGELEHVPWDPSGSGRIAAMYRNDIAP